MKITLNQDPSFPEPEVIINCPQADEDILRLVAMLRIYQRKLLGVLNGEQHLLDVKDILYIDTTDKKTFLYTETAVYESALRLYELEDGLLGGRMLVTMDNGEQVYVARQYAGELKEKLRELERSFLK